MCSSFSDAPVLRNRCAKSFSHLKKFYNLFIISVSHKSMTQYQLNLLLRLICKLLLLLPSDWGNRMMQTVDTDEFQPVSLSHWQTEELCFMLNSSLDSCWIENHSDCVSSSRLDHVGEQRLKRGLKKCKFIFSWTHDDKTAHSQFVFKDKDDSCVYLFIQTLLTRDGWQNVSSFNFIEMNNISVK